MFSWKFVRGLALACSVIARTSENAYAVSTRGGSRFVKGKHANAQFAFIFSHLLSNRKSKKNYCVSMVRIKVDMSSNRDFHADFHLRSSVFFD